ncbi:MAG TPA: PIN domain-containing protein [Solirubrobacteraceae bacterium]|nr:PIN domain-containing protein [Solirubrobacteraceae bacterium]
MSACLDSWAVLAWLDGQQPAMDRVSEVITSRPVISWINLVEVYCRLERDHGRDQADQTLSELRATLAPDLPGTARMIEAARLKARAAIALADCFAATTAAAHGLTLMTGDPELLELDDPPCALEDLRRPAGRGGRGEEPAGGLEPPRP